MTGNLRIVAICASLFSLALARDTSIVANPSWKTQAIPGEDPFDVPDCGGETSFIQQDFHDAIALAESARNILQTEFTFSWFESWYERLFTDFKDPANARVASRTDVRNDFNAVYTNNGLPDEIIFHCNEDWRDALFARRSIVQIDRPWSGCDDTTQAITTRIRSGDFPPGLHGDYGPGGAFRTGTHVMLCPSFFDLKPLGEIPPVTAGVSINDRINRGMVMLHELMHAYSRGIRDGGYGYGGCVDVSYGRIAPGMSNVKPRGNADTFALFALGVTEVHDHDLWDWTTGIAVRTSATKVKRGGVGSISGISGNVTMVKIPYSYV